MLLDYILVLGILSILLFGFGLFFKEKTYIAISGAIIIMLAIYIGVSGVQIKSGEITTVNATGYTSFCGTLNQTINATCDNFFLDEINTCVGEFEFKPNSFKIPSVTGADSDVVYLFPVLTFDPDTDEVAYVSEHIVEDYVNGTEFNITFYWAAEEECESQSTDVVWCIEYVCLDSDTGEQLSDPGSKSCVTDSWSYITLELQRTNFITMTPTDSLEDHTCGFQISRDANSVSDDLDCFTHLVSLTTYYESNLCPVNKTVCS